jgi:glutamine amidotransferase
VSRPVAVVRTGSANLASVLAALRRAGAAAQVTEDPGVVRAARRVVLPGVGAFGAVMPRLAACGIAEALRERLDDGRPLLAICLGMQLLAAGSEESPGVGGVGAIAGAARRFPASVRVPQLGWNRVTPGEGGGLLREGCAYFANSFYLGSVGDGWVPALASHGVTFVAAAERGPQLLCQFHPELSGSWGADLLDRWMDRC